jgi:hypothetical protein
MGLVLNKKNPRLFIAAPGKISSSAKIRFKPKKNQAMTFTAKDFSGYNSNCQTIQRLIAWAGDREFTIDQLHKKFPALGVKEACVQFMNPDKVQEYVIGYTGSDWKGVMVGIKEKIRRFEDRQDVQELRNQLERYQEDAKLTPVTKIVQTLWDNAKRDACPTGLDPIIGNVISSCISAQIKFAENDFIDIYKIVSGHGFHLSSNGHSCGEGFYANACRCNDSAAASFEIFQDRDPFILKNKRLFDGAEFKLNGFYFSVTGWNKEKQMTCVGYEKPKPGYLEKDKSRGKRTLKKFTREQWLEERKGAELLTDYSIRY